MTQARKSFVPGRGVAVAVILVGSMWIAPPAFATAASGFVGTQLAKGAYGPIDLKMKTDTFDIKLDTKGDADVYVTRNAIAVGGQSGWHTHPGPSLVTVTVGEITVYDGDDPVCPGHVYRAGEGSIDFGDGHLHLIRNESGAVAETVAVQFIARDAVRRIDEPKPTNCPY